MGLLKVNRTAIVMASALLLSCSTAALARDATLFSAFGKNTDKPAAQSSKPDVEPGLNLDGAIKQAQMQRKMNDLAGATRTLSQLVLVAPDDPRVLGEYGKTLVALGRSDDALAFLERAIELQPSDWSLFSAQGVAFDQKGDYARAQASYGRALEIKPGDPTVLSNNALSHIQSGDLDMAEQLLQQAAQSGSDYPRIAMNLQLVQSLKASRVSAVPAPQKAVVQAPVPVTPVQAADPVQPVPTPVMEPQAPGTSPNAPIEAKALPAPDAAMTAEAAGAAPQTLAIEGNPNVHMQRVPVDPLAGPVKKKAAPKKPATVADASAGKNAGQQTSLLRPALAGQ